MTRTVGTGRESVSYHRSRHRKRSTLSLTIRTALLAGVVSLVIAAGLAWQMAAGADPALKAGPQAAGSDPQRKVVQTTVVTRGVGSGSGSSSSASSLPATSPAPVVSAPAPVTSSAS